MKESWRCECGNDKFWFFGDFVRCPKCLNEMKLTKTGRKKQVEFWVRRYNLITHEYDKNWEHCNTFR